MNYSDGRALIKTIFGPQNTQFSVQDNGSINTRHFLDASQVFYPFFDSLGKIFTPAKNDITGNITFNEDPNAYQTLQDMLLKEIIENKTFTAIQSLLWLKRGLEYVQAFLHILIEDYNNGALEDNLISSLKKAYNNTLKQYHNILTQQLFNILAHSVPTKKQLFQQFVVSGLSNDALERNECMVEKIVMHDIKDWMHCLDTNLKIINAFYKEFDLEKLFD